MKFYPDPSIKKGRGSKTIKSEIKKEEATTTSTREIQRTIGDYYEQLVVSDLVVSNSFVTSWTVNHQDPLSMAFPRQEH